MQDSWFGIRNDFIAQPQPNVNGEGGVMQCFIIVKRVGILWKSGGLAYLFTTVKCAPTIV